MKQEYFDAKAAANLRDFERQFMKVVGYVILYGLALAATLAFFYGIIRFIHWAWTTPMPIE